MATVPVDTEAFWASATSAPAKRTSVAAAAAEERESIGAERREEGRVAGGEGERGERGGAQVPVL